MRKLVLNSLPLARNEQLKKPLPQREINQYFTHIFAQRLAKGNALSAWTD